MIGKNLPKIPTQLHIRTQWYALLSRVIVLGSYIYTRWIEIEIECVRKLSLLNFLLHIHVVCKRARTKISGRWPRLSNSRQQFGFVFSALFLNDIFCFFASEKSLITILYICFICMLNKQVTIKTS